MSGRCPLDDLDLPPSNNDACDYLAKSLPPEVSLRGNYLLRAGGAAMLGLVMVLVSSCNFGSSLGTYVYNGTTGAVSLLPSNTMTVRAVNMSQYRYNGVVWTMAADYAPTRLRTALGRGSSCSSAYHICVYAQSYARGVNGWASCRNGYRSGRDPNATCHYQVVRINTRYSPPRVRIACHELGHTVGLRHTGQQASCMKRTVDGGNSNTLSSHDRAHINNRY